MSDKTIDIPQALLEAGAVRFSPDSPFTWASGLKAPIYCDNRLLLGDPAVRGGVADALAAAVSSHKQPPTLLAGTSTAGIPWATLVADRLALPLAYVRPEAKQHGMGRRVEGVPVSGHRVILIEDLISTGGSSIKCVEALKAEGAEVLETLAIFSYGLAKAGRTFADAGVPLRPLSTLTALMSKAVRMGMLTKTAAGFIKDWMRVGRSD